MTADTAVRCVLYLRVSLDATGEQLAITRQRKECMAIAAARGWIVVGEFIDNSISAYSKLKDRPGYNAMVKAFEAGQFDALVCWDLDRLTRQPRQLEDWIDWAEERGLLLVTSAGDADLTTDNGRLFARIKASVARAESERKAARQRSAAEQRAGGGKPPLGVRLTGYTTGGDIIEAEAAVIRDIFTRFYEGDTIKGLVTWLGEQGATTRHGGPWRPSTVRTTLTNPRYAGRSYYNRKANKLTGPQAPGTWEPIVEDWIFDAVQDMLSDPRRRTSPTSDRKHLGSGLYLCGVCGAPVGSHSPARDGRPYRYRCAQLGHVTRTGPPVDELVLLAVTHALAEADAAAAFEPETGEARIVAEQIKRLHAQLRKTDRDYDNDLIDGERYKAKRDKLTAELNAAEAARAATAGGAAITSMMTRWEPGPDGVRAGLATLPLGSLRAVVSTLMVVRLAKAPRGQRFAPETVQIEWRR